ncbi:MAG: hypothetical protein WCK41_12165 [Actinomycetes bacterium]
MAEDAKNEPAHDDSAGSGNQCASCGGTLAVGAVFCGECGARTAVVATSLAAPPPPPPPPPPPSPSAVTVTAVSAIAGESVEFPESLAPAEAIDSGATSNKRILIAVAVVGLVLAGAFAIIALTSSGNDDHGSVLATVSTVGSDVTAPDRLSGSNPSTGVEDGSAAAALPTDSVVDTVDPNAVTTTQVSTKSPADTIVVVVPPASPAPEPPPTVAGTPRLSAVCPSRASKPGDHITVTNYGSAAGSFRAVDGNTAVSINPPDGTLPAGASINLVISVTNFDGLVTVTFNLAGGGNPSCTFQAQG